MINFVANLDDNNAQIQNENTKEKESNGKSLIAIETLSKLK